MAGEAAPFTLASGAQVAAAANGAEASSLMVAPFDGTVTAASIIPLTVLTGANTDSRTFQIFNRGQTGVGTTVVASKAFTAGVNAPAETTTALTLSVVAGATTVVSGDVIEIQSLHVGATGLAAPLTLGRVTFSRTAGS